VARYFVTTPIYYVNDAPHIGHAYTTVIADALARWHRLLGDDTFFLTGTDEHGLNVQRAAERNGVSPQEMADRTSERFRDAWKLLDISNDDFIRTTEPRHHTAVQAFLQRVYDNGHIELGTYEGLYCVSCEAYYTPDQLVDGLCPIHRRPVEQVKEENYFFKLSRFAQPLLDWYAAHPEFVRPETKRNEALGFIRGGLDDFSISRTSISWGVPLPWDPAHVTYVWYDALINYVTAAGFGVDDQRFATWWPAVHHLIGKDILRFHCVYWPAMLMAAGIDPPVDISVHGFLLVGGEKMSKTALNQIAPADLVDEFGVDGFRYHFLRDTAFGPDGDFSYERMVDRFNSDLANNFGNLLSRVATVVGKKCGGVGPAPRSDSPLAPVAAEVYAAAAEAWAGVQPAAALEATWRLIRETNGYLEDNEPWKMGPGAAVDAVLGDALEVLRIVSVLASPAIPSTAHEAWRRIGLDGSPLDQRLPDAAAWGGYPGGLPVTVRPGLAPANWRPPRTLPERGRNVGASRLRPRSTGRAPSASEAQDHRERRPTGTVRQTATGNQPEAEPLVQPPRRVVGADAQADGREQHLGLAEHGLEQLSAQAGAPQARDDGDGQLGGRVVDVAVTGVGAGEQAQPGGADRTEVGRLEAQEADVGRALAPAGDVAR
jgi:methionyl-tRNA synthetase